MYTHPVLTPGALAEALRHELERTPMPIGVIAKRAGVSRSTVHAVLKGETEPSFSTAARVAYALGLEIRLYDPMSVLPPTTGMLSKHSRLWKLFGSE